MTSLESLLSISVSDFAVLKHKEFVGTAVSIQAYRENPDAYAECKDICSNGILK